MLIMSQFGNGGNEDIVAQDLRTVSDNGSPRNERGHVDTRSDDIIQT
jgi:hypothetical protein